MEAGEAWLVRPMSSSSTRCASLFSLFVFIVDIIDSILYSLLFNKDEIPILILDTTIKNERGRGAKKKQQGAAKSAQLTFILLLNTFEGCFPILVQQSKNMVHHNNNQQIWDQLLVVVGWTIVKIFMMRSYRATFAVSAVLSATAAGYHGK